MLRIRHTASRLVIAVVAVVAVTVLSPAPGARAADRRDADIVSALRPGLWLEVRGRLQSDGVFVAERIEAQRPRITSRLWGVASRGAAPGSLVVLGRTLDVGPDTEWRGTVPAQAPGQRLRVKGHRGPGERFVATRVERRDPGVERISGRIDRRERRADGGVALWILGFEIDVPPDVKQRQEEPVAELGRSPVRPLVTDRRQLSDLDDYFGPGLVLSPRFHLGVQQDLNFTSRRDYQLDGDEADADDEDLDDASLALRARLAWTPSPRVSALVDARTRWRHRDSDETGAESDTRTTLNEAHLFVRDAFFGTDVAVGRQDFDEPREWLFDQNLDALRLRRRLGLYDLDLSLSTTLDGGSRRDRDATNTIVYLSRPLYRRELAAYVIDRDFGSRRDERQTHWGVRYLGRIAGPFDGWLELARLGGHRDERPIDAWGGDLGIRYRGRRPARWTVVAGLARGSGDTGGGDDGRFRQTGLQDNNGVLGGVTAVRYYGELMNPELSNLEIATLGLGRRVGRRASLELVAHRYRQEVASRRLTNTDLERRPDGVSRDLGWELDLVGGWRYSHWQVELVGAYFDHGEAFPDGDDATLVKLQIRYRY